MIQSISAKGRKMITIIDPHIKRESGYFLHEDALAQDLYVKDANGKVYEGEVLLSHFPYLVCIQQVNKEDLHNLMSFV